MEGRQGRNSKNPKNGMAVINATIPADTKTKIRQLATLDSRSMSNYLVVLVDREFNRVIKTGLE